MAATPSQAESMTTSKDVIVKTDEGESMELPTHTKLVHVLSVFVAGVIAVAVSTVLSDGTSVIKLRDTTELRVITSPAVEKYGFHWRADELLGPTYGIGLHHDQAGFSWTETGAESTLGYLIDNLGLPAVAGAVPRVISTDSLKHPVHFLQCGDLQRAGLAAMNLGFIAEAAACVMILFHLLVLCGLVPMKMAKTFGALVWLVLTAGFLIVIMLAIGIYTATWTCNQVVIPTIRISEHFYFSYGFYFAIIGYVSALLVLCVQLCCTATTDDDATAPAAKPSVGKTLGGVVAGLIVGAVCSVIVLGANDGFSEATNPIDWKGDVNPCAGQKPYHSGPNDHYFSNTECMADSIVQTLEQAGANVTRGYKGLLDAGDRVPITKRYTETDLCPVNVHWHLGTEHLSVGQFDEKGTGPATASDSHGSNSRQLAPGARLGYQCHYYDETNPIFTTPYDWKHCTNMQIGETYEIHWPHSAAGGCGTKWQYQSPFYDGVFCKDGVIKVTPLNTYEKIGVQSQVFTIVNSDDPKYYQPDLLKGMIVSGESSPGVAFGQDIAKYTGSTTGTSRDNQICSRYTPITWQVDRKCHMISASSFDKLCQDMLAQADDMSMDVYPHGSRMLVADHLTANNQQSRK